MRSVAILLTGTVHVGVTEFVSLTDPAERYRQYREAIERYLTDPGLRIVFCENSDADMPELEALASDTFEIVRFQGQEFEGSRGKGYGEAGIIGHALAHSRLLRDADLVVKITGRFYVHDLPRFVDYLQSHDDLEVCCNLIHSLTQVSSVLFAASRRFLEEWFLPERERIDDASGVYFEHVLADAVLRRIADAPKIVYHPIPFYMKTEGVLGTSNRTRDNRFHRNLGRRIITRLKYVLIRR